MLEILDAQPMGHTKTLVSRDNNCKICNMGSHRPLFCNMFRRMDLDNRRQAITSSYPSPLTCRCCIAIGYCHCYPRSTIASDGCLRSKSASRNNQQGVCVGPRATAEWVHITRHSHYGSTRTNHTTRKLSHIHGPWLSCPEGRQINLRSPLPVHREVL